jgi:hypothetical protein
MGVGVEFLGKQVRCPHCQQVVLAPLQEEFAPTLAPETSTFIPGAEAEALSMPSTTAPLPFKPFSREADDIFSPQADAGEGLFEGSDARRLELPREPANEQNSPHVPASTPPLTLDASPAVNGPSAIADSSYSQPADEQPALLEQSATRRAVRSGRPWFIPMVFIPLVLYSLVMTAAFLYVVLYWRAAPGPNLFEQMPDTSGDNPGVRKKKVETSFLFSKKDVTRPLPANLLVALKERIQIGELLVTPLSVERKRMSVFVEGFAKKPEPCTYDSLVLNLELENTSADSIFTPLDNYFDRKWQEGLEGQGPPPFTFLEVGENRFFGGPAEWRPITGAGANKGRRQWLAGRKEFDAVGLAPGEKLRTFVCTDGEDNNVALLLFGVDEGKKRREPYRGPLLWRVQLRRGLINHRGRALSATAVIGVEFTDEAYREGSRG